MLTGLSLRCTYRWILFFLAAWFFVTSTSAALCFVYGKVLLSFPTSLLKAVVFLSSLTGASLSVETWEPVYSPEWRDIYYIAFFALLWLDQVHRKENLRLSFAVTSQILSELAFVQAWAVIWVLHGNLLSYGSLCLLLAFNARYYSANNLRIASNLKTQTPLTS
jgi:hypothetical protein